MNINIFKNKISKSDKGHFNGKEGNDFRKLYKKKEKSQLFPLSKEIVVLTSTTMP